MGAGQALRETQKRWADREDIRLDAKSRTDSVQRNLFEPLSQDAQREFLAADGDELAQGGKMCSVYSSSALCVNVFHYLRHRGLLAQAAEACGLPREFLQSLSFEFRLPITTGPSSRRFPRKANLDLAFQYGPGADTAVIGVESKFTEPYGAHRPLSSTYLDVQAIWDGLANLRQLAGDVVHRPSAFVSLDVPQLLKHTLALCTYCSSGCGAQGIPRRFGLLYLWFDVADAEAMKHRSETDLFWRAAEADGVLFWAKTYQEVIEALTKSLGGEHSSYLAYLWDRYLDQR